MSNIILGCHPELVSESLSFPDYQMFDCCLEMLKQVQHNIRGSC